MNTSTNFYITYITITLYMYIVSNNRANSFAERLRLQLAVIHGDPKVAEDGRNSPPPFEPIVLTPSKSSKLIN